MSPFVAIGQQFNGRVTNHKGAPIENASVSLYKRADSTMLVQVQTGKDGYYLMQSADTAEHLLMVQAFGYTTIWKPCTQLKNDVQLKANNTLSEISVSARKPVIEQKVDRTIFNVENSAAATGGDAYSALRKTPNVQVMQGQIMVEGKGGVSVMLNGRLQQLSGDDLIQFLHAIPSSNISKIEVITTPGAKYDAEGNAGIINIVTKKNKNDGFKGNISLACTRNHYFSPSANTTLQYRKDKLNLVFTANTSTWNWVYTNRARMNYGNERWFQKVDQEYSNKNSKVQLSGDYAIGKKSLIGFSYAKGFGGSDNKEHVSIDVYGNTMNIDSTLRTEGTTHEVFKGKHTANLNYEWKIDSTGKKLNVDADYYTQQVDRDRTFGVTNYVGEQANNTTATQNRAYSGAKINISSLKADLELPYSFARLSLGGKVSVVNNDGYMSFFVKKPAGYEADSNRANRFLYDERIYSGYVNAQRSIGKLDAQAGLRMEHTWNEGYTPATKQINTRSYTSFFPSAKLLYKFNDDHSLAFTYQRRINRPGYNFLNPFRFYYSERSYSAGNPQLQPSFNHALTLMWHINQKHFIQLRTTQIRNYWDRLYFIDTISNVSALTRVNAGRAAFYGCSYGFAYTVAKWWELNGNISAEYSRFQMNAYGERKTYDGVNGWIDINNSFYLNKKKTLVADLHGYYYTPRQKDYKRWEEMSMFDGGIRAMLMNNNLVLGLSFEDPFAKAYWQQTNLQNGTTEYSYDDGRIVTLSVTFKFGNTNVKGRKDKGDSNEEMQRARGN